LISLRYVCSADFTPEDDPVELDVDEPIDVLTFLPYPFRSERCRKKKQIARGTKIPPLLRSSVYAKSSIGDRGKSLNFGQFLDKLVCLDLPDYSD